LFYYFATGKELIVKKIALYHIVAFQTNRTWIPSYPTATMMNTATTHLVARSSSSATPCLKKSSTLYSCPYFR